jgi:hypothetical protein
MKEKDEQSCRHGETNTTFKKKQTASGLNNSFHRAILGIYI